MNLASAGTGLAALVVAGLGVLQAANAGPSASPATGSSTSSVATTVAVPDAGAPASGGFAGTDLASRSSLVSRDSQRDALADASDIELQKMAEAQARQRNAALAALASSAEKFASKLAEQNSWVLPLTGYHLTAGFGEVSSLWSNTHTGLDFAAPEGTTLVAITRGTITQTGWAGSYGNRTILTLPDGTELWYCHQSSIGVRPGQQVQAGQPIGAVGATGNVTGPHLHLEVRPGAGDPVDPYAALVAHGLKP